MPLPKELNTQISKKKFSNLNQFTSATEWRHLTLTRLSITHNVYTMQDFKLAEKKKLAVSDNSGCFVLPSLMTPDHPVPLPSSFRFMKPLGMQVETYGITVKTMKIVFISCSLDKATEQLSSCSAPTGASA